MNNISKITRKIKFQDYFILPDYSNLSYTYYGIILFKKVMRLARLNQNVIHVNNQIIPYSNDIMMITFDNFQRLYNYYNHKYDINIPMMNNQLLVIHYFDKIKNRYDFALIKIKNKKNLDFKRQYTYFDSGNLKIDNDSGQCTSEFKLISWCYYSKLYDFLLELKN
jgi:hypothetical protein